MHPFFHHPAVRRFRIIFRWCRICLWMVLLLAVAAVSYLYLTGLPDFLKQPTLRQLLVRGLEAQFSNMQLVWGRGPSILVENSAFSRAGLPLSPRLTSSRAELELDWKALLHGRLEFRSLLVSGAQLQLPVSQAAGDVLLLNNVSLDMQFSQGDVVRLNRCRGTFRGIQTDLIGMLSHAGEVRRWRLPTEIGKTNETFESRLRLVARTLEKIQFTGTPVLRIEAGADGRDMNSFHVELNFDAPSAHTPWGDATDLSVDAACARLMESSHQSFLQVGCTASAMTTPWARSGKMFFLATFSHAANSNLEAQIELDATQFKAPLSAGGSNWVGAAQLSWSGTANLAPTNFMPLLAAGKLHAVEPESPWGSARQMSLEGRAAPAPGLTPPAGGWGPLAGFVPWSLNGQVEISKLASPKLSVDHLSISGHWRAPEVVIERVRGELYGGHADASGAFEADSRELRFVGTTDFNPHSVSQLLNPSVSNWLAQLDWTTPPKINAQMRIVLPPWTNRSPTWVSDVDSSLQLAGDFSVGQSSFDRVPASSAAGHVTYTNRVWDVSHLHALRPEGDVFMDYRSGPRDYHYLIESRLDPKAVLPLVAPAYPHALDELAFLQMPAIHAEIWGEWLRPEITGLTVTALASNFVVRGETVAAFGAGVDYTNRILTVRHLSLSNNQCQVQAPWLQADLGTKMVWMTNVTGIVDPLLLQRVLRANSPDFLNVIQFDAPPSVSASGYFSLTNSQQVDLRFLVNSRRLHYGDFLADRASGEVDWSGQSVAITNILANLYSNGTLLGWLVFVTPPEQRAEFHANFTGTDIGLSSLVTSFTGKSNGLEGRLDGDLDLAGPNSPEEGRWQGRGRIHVHDGLLWDIKIFGLLSPVLNLFYPGWGYSRAREASADFIITNSAVASDNVDVRCTGFVLKLRGKIDTNKQINARLEAVMSRETPVIGTLLSLAFTPLSKLLEYHVSGRWNDPVLEPVYVPKFITFLMHPFKATKGPSTSGPPPAPNAAKQTE